MTNRFRQYARPRDWEARRRAVLKRDEYRCTVIDSDGNRCTQLASAVDHVRAVREGGGHELENLRAICEWHHRRKTSREGNAARKRVTQQHPREDHPGLKRD